MNANDDNTARELAGVILGRHYENYTEWNTRHSATEGSERRDLMTPAQLAEVEAYVKAGAFITAESALYFLLTHIPGLPRPQSFTVQEADGRG